MDLSVSFNQKNFSNPFYNCLSPKTYKEGWNHIQLSCKGEGVNKRERIKSLAYGILLLIPIINSIALLILRTIYPNTTTHPISLTPSTIQEDPLDNESELDNLSFLSVPSDGEEDSSDIVSELVAPSVLSVHLDVEGEGALISFADQQVPISPRVVALADEIDSTYTVEPLFSGLETTLPTSTDQTSTSHFQNSITSQTVQIINRITGLDTRRASSAFTHSVAGFRHLIRGQVSTALPLLTSGAGNGLLAANRWLFPPELRELNRINR